MPSAFRIFEVILYALVNFLPYFFLALYPFTGKFRFSGYVNIILFTILTVFELAICTWASLFSSFNAPVSVINTVIYASFFILAIKEHPGKLVFVLLMMSNLANQIVFTAKCLEGILFPSLALQDNCWSYSVTSIISQAVFVPLFFLFLKKEFKEAVAVWTHQTIWNYLWLIPGTFYLFWFYIAYFNPLSGIELALQPMCTVFAVLINSGALLVYYVIARTVCEFAQNLDLRAQNSQLIIQNLQYENLKERMDETRWARHDLRQHMTVLRTLCENKEYLKLESYLQDYLKLMPIDHSIAYCEHFALNALLVYYAQTARNNQIDFNADISIPQNIPVNDTDLCVLFGNLLENACDGCLTCPEQERKIRLKGSMPNHGSIVFTLDNPFRGTIIKDNEKYLSTKHTGHGVGLESVQNIVNRYNGVLRIETVDGMFFVSVVLNL